MLRGSTNPILLIRSHEEAEIEGEVTLSQIIVALDGSEFPEAVLRRQRIEPQEDDFQVIALIIGGYEGMTSIAMIAITTTAFPFFARLRIAPLHRVPTIFPVSRRKVLLYYHCRLRVIRDFFTLCPAFFLHAHDTSVAMTREKIDKRMDELARRYTKIHNERSKQSLKR